MSSCNELSQYDVLLSAGIVTDISNGRNAFSGGVGDYTLSAAKGMRYEAVKILCATLS